MSDTLLATPDLSGRVAVVTGSGRGIGRQHALALADAGACVVVNDLGTSLAGQGSDPKPAREVVDEILARGGQAVMNNEDVADFAGAERLVTETIETFGRLDILVNNAGVLRDAELVDMSEDEWDDVIRICLKGHFAPTHHAARYWRERAEAGKPVCARVINTSSPSGVFCDVGRVSYVAAKAGIAAFTLTAAHELARYGVTVNCIAPTGRTRMTAAAMGVEGAVQGPDPIDPAHNAKLVLALASEQAKSITGQTFFVFDETVTVLEPWHGGHHFRNAEGWQADTLGNALVSAFPNGLAPVSAEQRMADAGGPPTETR